MTDLSSVGLVAFQRIVRAKQEKEHLHTRKIEEWQQFLDDEAAAFEKLLGDEELEPESELRPESEKVPTPTPLSSCPTANGDSDSCNPEEQQSDHSAQQNTPITVTDMLQEDPATSQGPRTMEEAQSQEALERCRIEAEEVFDHTFLDIKRPRRNYGTAPLSVVEVEERSARKKLQTAEQSFRYAIRDFLEADRNYLTRRGGSEMSPTVSSLHDAQSAFRQRRREEAPKESKTKVEAEEQLKAVPAVEATPAPELEDEEGQADNLDPRSYDDRGVSDGNEDWYDNTLVEPEPKQEPEPEMPFSYPTPITRGQVTITTPNRADRDKSFPREAMREKPEADIEADESPGMIRDEVFPGAHEIMLNLLYEVYGLMPSNQFRMTSMDFFDSVSAVGSTFNMEEYDDTIPYRPELSLSVTPEYRAVPPQQLWTDEHLFSYVDTWLDQMSARKQMSNRRDRRQSVDGRGLFAPYYSSNGERRKGRSPVDWVMLKDCCIILVNGLGSAYTALQGKDGDAVTKDRIRDWSLQYIHYGLQRLLADQTGAHSVTFRSVFSLLCPSPRRRVLYAVFEAVFLSQVVDKSTQETMQQKTNIDFYAAFMKKQGVTYLPFSAFLRHLCHQTRGVSLLKLRQILEIIMQPTSSVKLLRFFHVKVPGFPVHLVRRGVDCLASMLGASQTFIKFLEVEPKKAPTIKDGDKTPQELLKVVVQRSPIEVGTHIATKCLLILVLFVNWMETDFKEVEVGQVDVRFWTQRIFSEANAYYRIAQNPSSEADQKAICADVVTLFYSFFDTNGTCDFLKYVKSKKIADLDAVSTLRHQISEALEVTGNSRNSTKTVDKDQMNVVSDDANFKDRPDGPLLLRRLINNLMSSVGAIFFSYDMYIDGVVTFYSKEHVESTASSLDANHYKQELRLARNPFREMDAVTFYVRTFNRMMEKTMGLLQAMWAGTRWLRAEVQLCTTGRVPDTTDAYVPRTFSQCASLLADCIIAGWPHQRRERSPFRRVPRRGSVAEYEALKEWQNRGAADQSGSPSEMGSAHELKTDFDGTHRSIDSIFADLVITNESESAKSSVQRLSRPS